MLQAVELGFPQISGMLRCLNQIFGIDIYLWNTHPKYLVLTLAEGCKYWPAKLSWGWGRYFVYFTVNKCRNSPHHCPVLGFLQWEKCRLRKFEDVFTVHRATHSKCNTSSSTFPCPFSLQILFSEVTAKKTTLLSPLGTFFQVPLKSIAFCPLASSIIHKYFVVVIFYIKNFQTPLNYQLQSHLIACLQHQKAKKDESFIHL